MKRIRRDDTMQRESRATVEHVVMRVLPLKDEDGNLIPITLR